MGHGPNSDGDINRTFKKDMVRTAFGDIVRPNRPVFHLRTWFDQTCSYKSMLTYGLSLTSHYEKVGSAHSVFMLVCTDTKKVHKGEV